MTPIDQAAHRADPAGAAAGPDDWPLDDRPDEQESEGQLISNRTLWWYGFLVLATIFTLWSLASPLYSSPDEPAHVIKAAAVARGQLLGTDERTVRGDTVTHVRVPGSLVPKQPCFAHHPDVTANCQKLPTSSTKDIDTTTAAGHYQPLYYALVGVGSLMDPGPHGVYLMRLISSLLNAALLASAFASVRHWPSGFGPLGLAVATTPMVFFLGSGVNPSGLEICAAICAWASVATLWAEPDQVDRRLLVRLGVSASALVLCRSLSPLWLAVVVGITALAARPQTVWLRVRRTDVLVCAGVILMSTLVASAWILSAGALTLRADVVPPNLTVYQAVSKSFDSSPRRIWQMIGNFGWLDTSPSMWAYVVWIAGVGLLVLLCLSTASRRPAAALVLLGLVVVLVPVFIEASQEKTLGLVWQGRYTLPIAVGLPLLAAHYISFDRVGASELLGQRLAAVTLPALASAVFVAYLWNLRRYTVGAHGGLGLLHRNWNPPLPPLLLLAALLIALAGWWWWLTPRRRVA